MEERGILFSAPMVRALLEGSKTQTRRALKDIAPGWPEAACPYGQPGHRLWVRETFFAFGCWKTRYNAKKNREEWYFVDMTLESGLTYQYAAEPLNIALATGRGRAAPAWFKRPAIFMPRVASRLLLEVASVRVERLNDCSEADAYAEGVEPVVVPVCCGEPHRENHGVLGVETHCCGSPMEDERAIPAYRALWEQINGPGSWDANPWVWVVEFKRVMP